MINHRSAPILRLAILVIVQGHAATAASFHNLDFEQAHVSLPSPFEVPAADAMPGWTTNNFMPGFVRYDDICLDEKCISIHDAQSIFPNIVVEGSFSAYLQTGSVTPDVEAFISQTGDVSPSAMSLHFLTSEFSHFAVTLDGQAIPLVSTTGINGSTLRMGDVSSFAGKTAELRFSGSGLLDSISFSALPAPEPSGLVLLGWVSLLWIGWGALIGRPPTEG